MLNRSVSFFISSHSSRGFVSFFHSCFDSLDKKWILSGWPRKDAEKALQEILTMAQARMEPVWKLLFSLDGSLEGLILPDRSAGVLIARPWDNALVWSGSALEESYRPVQQALDEAHAHFAAALPIHDQWEGIYRQHIHFDALDALTKETISQLFSGQSGRESGQNQLRFLGPATKDGSVDCIPEITAGLQRRIFIKGRPGTGKSTFLKKVRAAANQAGWDTEEYRCAFDPNSADMVVIPGLGLCLFDSTAPHEHFPSLPGDEILDFFKAAVEPDTDSLCETELAQVQQAYRAEIRLATGALKAAAGHLDALEEMRKAVDKKAAEEQCKKLAEELFKESR